MRKVAIFTEGSSEQIFVRHLLTQVIGWGKISFDCYYNPTGTRNIEYDPKQPLFKWRTRDERMKYKITAP